MIIKVEFIGEFELNLTSKLNQYFECLWSLQ